jgi:hypothetical protein
MFPKWSAIATTISSWTAIFRRRLSFGGVGQEGGAAMAEYVYRYRPIGAVLDEFHELENQEIYFSTINELNDPMEGYKDLFWQGDAIIWQNLLKHYTLCLLQTVYCCFVTGDQFDANIVRNLVFSVPGTLPDAPIREIYKKIAVEFLAEPAVEKFISLMAERSTPLRRMELTRYLRALHGFAIQIVMEDCCQRGLLPLRPGAPAPPPRGQLRDHVTAMMENVTKIASSEHPPEKISEALFTANEATVAQLLLINEYNISDREKQLPIIFVTSRFPSAYVAALERLVHRDQYVACFAKTADNHSMWSTYANGHRGVCLMFKTTDNPQGNPTLTLERITAASGSRVGRPRIYRARFLTNCNPCDIPPNIPRLTSLGRSGRSRKCI